MRALRELIRLYESIPGLTRALTGKFHVSSPAPATTCALRNLKISSSIARQVKVSTQSNPLEKDLWPGSPGICLGPAAEVRRLCPRQRSSDSRSRLRYYSGSFIARKPRLARPRGRDRKPNQGSKAEQRYRDTRTRACRDWVVTDVSRNSVPVRSDLKGVVTHATVAALLPEGFSQS